MFPKLRQIVDQAHSALINVEWKGYITVDVGRNPRAVNVYWQLVDPVFSLLELGFEYPSGRLVKCAVPLFNGEVEDRRTELLPNAASGTPLFDISSWTVNVTNPAARSNHLEQPGRIRLLKKQNGLSIVCQERAPLRSVAYGKKLICDFGEGDELVALGLVGDFPV